MALIEQGRFYHIGGFKGYLSYNKRLEKFVPNEASNERHKQQLHNRMVYNDWGLYGFVQMLTYKCLCFGKD